MTSTNNDWYIYTDDIYGCHGIYGGFPSLDDVVVELTLERLGVFINSSIGDEGKEELAKIIEQFQNSKLDNISFGEQIEAILKANEAEISTLYVDNFDSLCLGKSDFSLMAIEEFCDHNEREPISSISEDLKVEFSNFVKEWVISIWS